MRLVVDTNVIVSGLLNGAGFPGKLINAILRGEITVVYSEPILAEYREVLVRPKFGFDAELVKDFVELLEREGEWVNPAVSRLALPDENDRIFVDAALTAMCPITTGNTRHFPQNIGIEILTPAQCFEFLK